MAHHSSEMSEVVKKLFGIEPGKPNLSATGQYPNGKLNDDDEGEIKIAVAADHARRVVVIDFGKPTAWIGFTLEQASELATMIQEKAWELRGIKS